MHEFSTMSQIVDAILQEAKKHDAIDVKEVHLEIGELTFLLEEPLKFAYEILSKDSILERSKLIVKEKRAMVSCNSCGYGGEIDYDQTFSIGPHMGYPRYPKISCPECDSRVEIVAGKECTIRNIVICVEG